ncbi:hypothetical protein DQ04_13831000 [Trypanosoma grayi]|uniref:hypothetical protein n=1 Tax=Trypanosoma grayi TaxID=71804 RepID=UPI0004F47D1C|nr:hypothetical protein DQ04_13831000 [Trypanosoma grayi]KEG06457.1 hypothetical protein DQ04_13831000 [Trypanosoma grayi]
MVALTLITCGGSKCDVDGREWQVQVRREWLCARDKAQRLQAGKRVQQRLHTRVAAVLLQSRRQAANGRAPRRARRLLVTAAVDAAAVDVLCHVDIRDTDDDAEGTETHLLQHFLKRQRVAWRPPKNAPHTPKLNVEPRLAEQADAAVPVAHHRDLRHHTPTPCCRPRNGGSSSGVPQAAFCRLRQPLKHDRRLLPLLVAGGESIEV